MKKITLMLMLEVLSASVSMATLISHSSFDDAVSTNGIPAGWTAVAGTGAHSSIKAGSLSYAGYPSTGNSWGLAQGTEDYRKSFSGVTGLGSGDHVYFSLLLRLNSPLDSFTTGTFRLYNSAAPTGSGLCLGWGTSDYTQNTMGFALGNRNGTWNTAETAGTLQHTAQTYTAADTTYLIVLGYNRGANAAGSSVDLWINPSSSSFGDTPPTSTIHMLSYQNATGYNNECAKQSV